MYIICLILCAIIALLLITIKKLAERNICTAHELNLAYQIITKEPLNGHNDLP